MANKLLIVETSHLKKDIQDILDSQEPSQWIVTVGFVYGLIPISRIVLPRSGELVIYETTKGQRRALAHVHDHAREDTDVYLATGRGLKGESHAWHLQRYLGLENPKRVILHEISSEGIKAALVKARAIDVHLVKAYEEHLSTREGLKRLHRACISRLHVREPAPFDEELSKRAKISTAQIERKRIASVEAEVEMLERWAERCVYAIAATANKILESATLGVLEKQAMLKDLEELAIDPSLWRKLVHGEPRMPVLTLPNLPKKPKAA